MRVKGACVTRDKTKNQINVGLLHFLEVSYELEPVVTVSYEGSTVQFPWLESSPALGLPRLVFTVYSPRFLGL